MSRAMFLAGIFLAFAALLGVTSRIAAGDGATPPPPGDTQDYDNIALQLLRGRGFAIDYADPEWRRPYERHNSEGDFDEILTRKVPFHFTTYRPPLLPFALAVTYRIFGRDFLTWRIIESLLTAIALMLVCDVAWRALGPRVALLAAALMFLSGSYILYIAHYALLTEPLAIFLVAVIVWTLSLAGGAHPYGMAAVCGVALALLCLTRTFYLAWLPLLAALIWRTSSRHGRAAILVVVAAVVVQAPWWVRNCRVTGAFMPFGTEPGVGMNAAYGNLANTGGPMVKAGWIAPVFWLVLVAPFILWRQRAVVQVRVLSAIVLLVAVNALVMAMTWTVPWRSFVPVEPLLTVLAAVPLTGLFFGEHAIGAAP